MSLSTEYGAVLGSMARRSDFEWQLADPESARLAVSIAIRRRALLAPGHPRPGRTGLRPPAGIQTLWAEELVARVGAGTTVEELELALAPHGLALGLEVPDPSRATLGACFAGARSGFASPCGTRLRDRCIGLGFVDGHARVLAAGSRVVKNVAGYDFGRLHHGAQGSLGLILDLTLRLVARPEASVAVWWACDREDIPVALPELRRQWGQDATAEVFVDRVAAVRYGLPGAGVVFRQSGDAAILRSRIQRSNAVDVSDRWGTLLGASLRPVRRCPASALSIEDPGEDWVADLAAGVVSPAKVLTSPSSGASRAARALKRVFDPHGIWPDLPEHGDGS